MDGRVRQTERVRLDGTADETAQDRSSDPASTWLDYRRGWPASPFNQRLTHFDQQRIGNSTAVQLAQATPAVAQYGAEGTHGGGEKAGAQLAPTERSVANESGPLGGPAAYEGGGSDIRYHATNGVRADLRSGTGGMAIGGRAETEPGYVQTERGLPSGENANQLSGVAPGSGSRKHKVDVEREEQQLTEVVAPAPEGLPRLRHLESARQHQEPAASRVEREEQQLTEVAAPAPEDWQTLNHLESAREKQKAEASPPDSKSSEYLTLLYMVSHLTFFSILGTLARLGIQWLTFYPGAPVVFSNLWANFGGTLAMGFLSEDRQLFFEEWGDPNTRSQKGETSPSDTERDSAEIAKHKKVKKQIPFYAGLTVGFCGSLTSFSTFIRDAFFALSNTMPSPINHPNSGATDVLTTVPRNGGYSFEALLAVIILTITVSIGALRFGAHIAFAVDRVTPSLPFSVMSKLINPLAVFLGFGCWIGAVIMAAVPPDRPGGPVGKVSWSEETWRGQVLFALVFTPPGCLLRYFLAVKLNSLVEWIPLGTFFANVFGTVVLGMCYDLQHAPLLIGANSMIGGGLVGCQVLQGVQDGFCGSLTTVSTWIVELTTLRKRHAYYYGGLSVVVSLALLIIIMGSVLWSIGFSTGVCVVEIS